MILDKTGYLYRNSVGPLDAYVRAIEMRLGW